jgi:hypothetical protein
VKVCGQTDVRLEAGEQRNDRNIDKSTNTVASLEEVFVNMTLLANISVFM